jgi:molybdopterin converting factor subunit 1
MNVRVKLFAVAKQRIGRAEVDVALPDAATVRQLRGAIVEQYPALADVLAHARLAVNSDYAADTTVISPMAEIAIIPPVSGG